MYTRPSQNMGLSRLGALAVALAILVGALPVAAQRPALVAGPQMPQGEELLELLGIQPVADPTDFSLRVAEQVVEQGFPAAGSSVEADAVSAQSAGLPDQLDGDAATSAAVLTAQGGFAAMTLLADADGREDLMAEHAAKLTGGLGPSAIVGPIFGAWQITRVAMSEHTIANGFDESVYYYGDSVGNVFIGLDTAGDALIDAGMGLHLPTILNAFGSLNSDDQIVITGLAVNPVADLTSFANVNYSFAPFGGEVGEILYVSFWDTGGGLRLAPDDRLVRSGLLAFPIADVTSPPPVPPGVQSPQAFPIMVGGAFGVVFSTYANLAGVAVDDDGSVYFHQVDLQGFTGGNVVKITDIGSNYDRSLATSGFKTIMGLAPDGGDYGATNGPPSQVNLITNFSGTSPLFGNIVALAAGPDNTLYAAVARSFVAGDPAEVRATEGLFPSPDALGPTPSMIINFSDATGAFDACSGGQIPVGDGFADAVVAGQAVVPGENNYRVFAMGTGPDARAAVPGASAAETLKLDFQVDYTMYAGLAADEENKVYVVSGGTPAGVGRDPSPELGEILVFPDADPADRRADMVDLRGDAVPTPPRPGMNVGDGDSDRYDHVFWRAPLDQVTITPGGITGLARGFLMYLNRTRPVDNPFPTLPNGAPQYDDKPDGPIDFNAFDPSGQVAGGVDDLWGCDPVFDFLCIGGQTVCSPTFATGDLWLNPNGSVSFGEGDASYTPVVTGLLTHTTRIAPAWADLHPFARTSVTSATFPVQALGFAGVNHFKLRWINVPEYGWEACGSRNTFSVSLFDDGTGMDEAAPGSPGCSQTPEGPTALRYRTDPTTGQLVGLPPRLSGTGRVCFDYGRMDLLGEPYSPVVVGYSGGEKSETLQVAELNLGERARAAALDTMRPYGIPLWTFRPEVAYELFDEGTTPELAGPDYDLRAEGNDLALTTPGLQPDLNRGQVCFYYWPHSIYLAPILRDYSFLP